MTHYTATAERGSIRWVVQCDQLPAALTEVNRLDQAVEYVTEVIAYLAGIPESEVEVTVTAVIDPAITAELERVEELRTQSRSVEQEAMELRRKVAARLQADGLTLRDIGVIMGVAHQRVHQLLTAA